MDMTNAIFIAASGMRAQSERLRVVAENLANANSISNTPGGTPYQRKTISFRSELDRKLGADIVKVARIGRDPSPFQLRFEPSHPAADKSGYVAYPNVQSLIEMADMREAQRSYEANLSVIEITKGLVAHTLEILRG
jgi:flagellar basal-body rod protein FlgC